MDTGDFRLGALLVDAGLVDGVWIKRALTLSSNTGLPIGKSLVLLDCIQDEELSAAIEAQSMIKDGILNREAVKSALSIVRRRKWQLADALVLLGIDAHFVRGTRLGELLIESGKLDSTRLKFALKLVDSTRLPLGHVLVALNEISLSMLEVALRIQRKIRGGHLERPSGLFELKHHKEPAEVSSSQIRFGELLVMSASILPEETIISAVLVARRRGIMLGQLLLEEGQISESILIAAIQLQDLVWRKLVTVIQAREVLLSIYQLDLSVEDGFKQVGLSYDDDFGKQLPLCDFLKVAGYLTGAVVDDIRRVLTENQFVEDVYFGTHYSHCGSSDSSRAIKSRIRNNNVLVRLLRKARPYDREVHDSAVLLHQLVAMGKMRIEQAIIQLNLRKLSQEGMVA